MMVNELFQLIRRGYLIVILLEENIVNKISAIQLKNKQSYQEYH